MQVTKASQTLFNVYPTKIVRQNIVNWKDERGHVVKTEIILVDMYNKSGVVNSSAKVGGKVDIIV